MTTYEYTKTPVDIDRLTLEIQQSSITIALDNITLLGSEVTIAFKVAISNDEKTTLDTVVANHSGEPMPDDHVSKVDVTNTSLTAKLSYPIESGTSWLKVRPRRIAGDLYINFVYFTTTSTGSFDAGDDPHFSMSVSEDQTKTYIDFNPDYTYEAGGGGIIMLSSTSTGECKVTFIGAPDYPPEYGGSIEFIRNKKLSMERKEYILNDIDPKSMRYSAGTPGTNKLRLQVEHAADEKISFEYYLVMSGSL